jgi:hypothetical protein
MEEVNHDEAVRWFERAMPHLLSVNPEVASGAAARHGERFVSMGISYWQVGARDEAVKLTENGLEVMQLAADESYLEETALAVPYGNLASMYRAMGKMEEARKMAVVAARLERESEATEH